LIAKINFNGARGNDIFNRGDTLGEFVLRAGGSGGLSGGWFGFSSWWSGRLLRDGLRFGSRGRRFFRRLDGLGDRRQFELHDGLVGCLDWGEAGLGLVGAGLRGSVEVVGGGEGVFSGVGWSATAAWIMGFS